MTSEQRDVLERQVQRLVSARNAAAQEEQRLRELLVMFDARFADPGSGMTFDTHTLTISEREPRKDAAEQ